MPALIMTVQAVPLRVTASCLCSTILSHPSYGVLPIDFHPL